MSLLDDRVLLVSSEEGGETDTEEEEEERAERGEEEGGSGEVGPEERRDGEGGGGECGAGDVGVQYEAGRESCVRRVFGVEVTIALCAFSWGLHEVVLTNLTLDKVCNINLNLSSVVCANIQAHDQEQVVIQQKVTMLSLYWTCLNAPPCFIVPLLLGPWSDSHGRKVVILLPVLGQVVAQIVYIGNVYFWALPAEWMLLSSLSSLGGGGTTLAMGVYSVLADTTSTQDRTARVSLLDVSITVGWSSGTFLSGPVFQTLGYYGTFSLCLSCSLLALAYTWLWLRESLPAQPQGREEGQGVLEAWREVSGPQRCNLLLLLGVMVLYVSANSGDLNYLYTRVMFDWDVTEFTRVSTLFALLAASSSLLLLPFLSLKLEVDDSLVGFLSSLLTTAALLVTALAHRSYTFIFAGCLGLMNPMISSVARSLLSKQVPPSSLGSLYSVLGCLEALAPLLSTPLLTLLYNSSLPQWPGAVFLARSAAMAMVVCLYTLLHCRGSDTAPIESASTLHQRQNI